MSEQFENLIERKYIQEQPVIHVLFCRRSFLRFLENHSININIYIFCVGSIREY